MAQATTLYLVINTVRIGPVEYKKGAMVYLTATQVTAIGASNLRTVNNPTAPNGAQSASHTHDTLGEAAGVSNSS